MSWIGSVWVNEYPYLWAPLRHCLIQVANPPYEKKHLVVVVTVSMIQSASSILIFLCYEMNVLIWFSGWGSSVFTNSEYMFHLFYACLIHIENTHNIMSHIKILNKSLGLPLSFCTGNWTSRSNIRLIFDCCWGIIAKNISSLNSTNLLKWRKRPAQSF